MVVTKDETLSTLSSNKFKFDTIITDMQFAYRVGQFVENAVKAGDMQESGIRIYFIADNDNIKKPPGVEIDGRIYITIEDEENIIRSFEQFFELPSNELPYISNGNSLDEILRFQIRRIDTINNNFQEGKNILQMFVLRIPLQQGVKVESFEVDNLGQGFSGSLVFKVLYKFKDENNTYKEEKVVLKLTPSERYQEWKAIQETRCYIELKELFDRGFVKRIPQVQGFTYETGRPRPVQISNWLGLMYSFVEDPNSSIMDFEKFFLKHSVKQF